ncbi:nucleotide-binding alpha-beta plait domain-containing protein [Tanacetum coccineum]
MGHYSWDVIGGTSLWWDTRDGTTKVGHHRICSAKDLFLHCKQYGHVVDSFIPNKRSKSDKRFGFVKFINVFNEEILVNNLCNGVDWSFKLWQILPRFKRENKTGRGKEGRRRKMARISDIIKTLVESLQNGVISWTLDEDELNIIPKGEKFIGLELRNPGWIPEFNDEEEEDGRTEFGVPSGEKVNKSEDPFGIYSLLQKNKTNMENKVMGQESSWFGGHFFLDDRRDLYLTYSRVREKDTDGNVLAFCLEMRTIADSVSALWREGCLNEIFLRKEYCTWVTSCAEDRKQCGARCGGRGRGRFCVLMRELDGLVDDIVGDEQMWRIVEGSDRLIQITVCGGAVTDLRLSLVWTDGSWVDTRDGRLSRVVKRGNLVERFGGLVSREVDKEYTVRLVLESFIICISEVGCIANKYTYLEGVTCVETTGGGVGDVLVSTLWFGKLIWVLCVRDWDIVCNCSVSTVRVSRLLSGGGMEESLWGGNYTRYTGWYGGDWGVWVLRWVGRVDIIMISLWSYVGQMGGF